MPLCARIQPGERLEMAAAIGVRRGFRGQGLGIDARALAVLIHSGEIVADVRTAGFALPATGRYTSNKKTLDTACGGGSGREVLAGVLWHEETGAEFFQPGLLQEGVPGQSHECQCR